MGEVGKIIVAIIAAAGIPSAVFAFLIRSLEKRLDRERAERRAAELKKEANQKEYERVLLECSTTAITLSEAVARAVQRIPDAHCNGDMDAALSYAATVKRNQREFMSKLGIEYLHM